MVCFLFVWATTNCLGPPFSALIPPMEVGVPQGSVLSPTLFNLYLSPLANLVESYGAQIVSYADDTQLLFTCDKDSEFQGEAIKTCLSAVFSWLQLNELKCNSDKSEIIFFGCPPNNLWQSWWPHDMHPPANAVLSVKNLGVKLDNSLNIKLQVQTVAGQCFGLLKMLKQFLPLLQIPHRKTVVQAMIGSRLDYVNILYLGLPEYLLSRLQVVQNSAARAILCLNSRTRISTHLNSLHLLPIRKRIQFKALVLAFKSLQGLGAPYLRKRVKFYHPLRSLRSASLALVCTPVVKHSRIGGRSFQFQVAKL